MAFEVTADWFAERLAGSPVIAILRGLSPPDAARAAEEIWTAGVDLVEVPLSGEGSATALRAVCERAGALGRDAGAGTVSSPAQLEAAIAAGARFAIAAGLDSGTVTAAHECGLPLLPGIATPSELQAALAMGCTTVKLFPADLLGPDWLRALHGPFPHARIVAVGGITHANARSFLEAGAIGVAIGSALVPSELPYLLSDLRSAAGQPQP